MFDAPDAPRQTTIDPDAPRWREENHLGAVCVFQPLELLPDFETEYGKKLALRCNVLVTTGPGAGARYDDALIFGTVVVGQLQEKIGRTVLARLAQGEKRPGKRPPWKLDADSVTQDEATAAVRAMTSAPDPAPAAAPVQAAPVAQPGTTGAPRPPWET